METTVEKRPLVIVENEREFSATLFKPINGRTADGYVRKRGKNFCDVFLAGKICRVNKFGVWCEQGSDKRWTFANLSQFGYMALCDAAAALAVESVWVGSEKEYRFTKGCGNLTHVEGTNGGKMPCGSNLTQFGTTAPYFCAKCEPRA